MQIEPVETAPRDGAFIILHDAGKGVYEIGRWSASKGQWDQENGAPIRITPTHWTYFPDGHGTPSADGPQRDARSEFARRTQLTPKDTGWAHSARTLVAFCSVTLSATVALGLLCLAALNRGWSAGS